MRLTLSYTSHLIYPASHISCLRALHACDGRGQTELAGGATGMSRAYGGIKLGSCNQVVPNTRLQVRHTETDQPLGAGEVGEIVIRGPQVMLGYRNNQEANRQTFDDCGWMRTGDIGYYDTEGFVYIVDRMKELIKVKGLQERSDCSPLSSLSSLSLHCRSLQQSWRTCCEVSQELRMLPLLVWRVAGRERSPGLTSSDQTGPSPR